MIGEIHFVHVQTHNHFHHIYPVWSTIEHSPPKNIQGDGKKSKSISNCSWGLTNVTFPWGFSEVGGYASKQGHLWLQKIESLNQVTTASWCHKMWRLFFSCPSSGNVGKWWKKQICPSCSYLPGSIFHLLLTVFFPSLNKTQSAYHSWMGRRFSFCTRCFAQPQRYWILVVAFHVNWPSVLGPAWIQIWSLKLCPCYHSAPTNLLKPSVSRSTLLMAVGLLLHQQESQSLLVLDGRGQVTPRSR